MKTVFRIFSDDVRSLSRRFFASAVIVAVAFLPALYAWVNIYANGNPYANTGGIKIALASNDPGIDLDDGTHVNMAEEIFETQKESDKIGWQFPKTADEAIEGVRSGRYYAAIIFEDNFTYNMYHFEQAMLDEKVPLTYYENQKANAIAPKITQTAASTLQESIKTKYLETVFGIVFGETNDVADKLADADAVDTAIDRLKSLRDTLLAYDRTISSFNKSSEGLESGISNAENKLYSARSSARSSAAEAKADIARARESVSALSAALSARQARLASEIEEFAVTLEKLKSAGLSPEKKAALEERAKEQADNIKADLEDLRALFPDDGNSELTETIRNTLDNMISDVKSAEESIENAGIASKLAAELKKLNEISLTSAVDSLIGTLDTALSRLTPVASSITAMLDSIDPVLDSAGTTVSSLTKMLNQMRKVFRGSADRIDDVIDRVEDADADEKLDILIDLLGGDPGLYADFFSSLVDVEVTEVYPVASYGAAMAPFYSVLAIWVGGVILVSILKTHIDRRKYPGATEAEAFFGRFILFFILGQAQAAVIVAGDIFLLGCEPVHPWLMWLAGAVTSLVFTTLIYALTLSFGDIGKAMVVVVMVLQIAGSSGSYPIEILPAIFGKGFKFFPFPYAINAMREALCGTYGHDFVIYLAQLLIFWLIALAIGLLVRKPFIGMNDFVSEKIEETEVL